MKHKDLKDVVFDAKYRPQTVDDVICQHIKTIKALIADPLKAPHFLFVSPTPGTGKTSLAYAIINDLKCDKLVINASKDRKIETIREKVTLFASSKSSRLNTKRCVLLEEADGMTRQSLDSLRNVMELYSDTCMFILTCNYIEKIHPAIRSRCQVFEFTKPDKMEIGKRLAWICKQEDIKYESKGILKLIQNHYPSIRDMVLELQRIKASGQDLTEQYVSSNDEMFMKAWEMIKARKFTQLRKLIIIEGLNVTLFNKWLFDHIIVIRDQIGILAMKQIIQLLAQNERDFANGCDEKIIFQASAIKMMDYIQSK